MKEKKRNGEIDILRFMFAISIVLNHLPDYVTYKMNLKWSYFGVEFFFLLSGLLIARHANNVKSKIGKTEIYDEVWKYTLKRVMNFWPYFIVTIILNALSRMVIYKNIARVAIDFIDSIPLMLLIHTIIGKDGSLYLTGNWYLSAMIVASFILYYLLLKNVEMTTKILSPLFFIFGVAYLLMRLKTIEANHDMGIVINLGFLRAFSEMSLGVCLFEIVKKLEKIDLSSAFKCSLAIIKYMAFLIAFLFSMGYFDESYIVSIIIILAVGICMSFTNNIPKIESNKVTDFIGKISLVIYLCQYLVLKYAIYIESVVDGEMCTIIILMLIISLAIFIYLSTEKLKKIVDKVVKSHILVM